MIWITSKAYQLAEYSALRRMVSTPQRTKDEILEQVVNARELHEFLASKQNFSNWIKSRINKYDFIENVDYLINKIIVQLPV